MPRIWCSTRFGQRGGARRRVLSSPRGLGMVDQPPRVQLRPAKIRLVPLSPNQCCQQRNNVVEKEAANASGNGRLQHNMRTVDRDVPNVLPFIQPLQSSEIISSSAQTLRRCSSDRCVSRTLTDDKHLSSQTVPAQTLRWCPE